MYGSVNSVPSDMDALIGDTVGDCEHAHKSVGEVGEAIRELSVGKACGTDDIFAEHLKYASSRLIALLSICFM